MKSIEIGGFIRRRGSVPFFKITFFPDRWILFTRFFALEVSNCFLGCTELESMAIWNGIRIFWKKNKNRNGNGINEGAVYWLKQTNFYSFYATYEELENNDHKHLQYGF
jgi:hypothetical protein